MVNKTGKLCTLVEQYCCHWSLIFITLSTAVKIVTARLNSWHSLDCDNYLIAATQLPLFCLTMIESFHSAAYGLRSPVSPASPASCYGQAVESVYKMAPAGRSDFKSHFLKLYRTIFYLHSFRCGGKPLARQV